MGPDDVLDYARKLRAAGIEEVAFSLQPTAEGVVHHVTAIRLSVAAPPAEPVPTRLLSEEELRNLAREKRRKSLSVELGFVPDDALLEKLP